MGARAVLHSTPSTSSKENHTIVTLPRHADVPLSFNGELIADVSSEEDGNDRWEELKIWRTDSERVPWVVQRVGKSVLPGEVDVIRASRCKSELMVRNTLKKRDPRDKSRWYMTDLSMQALETAADADPRLRTVLVEQIT